MCALIWCNIQWQLLLLYSAQFSCKLRYPQLSFFLIGMRIGQYNSSHKLPSFIISFSLPIWLKEAEDIGLEIIKMPNFKANSTCGTENSPLIAYSFQLGKESLEKLANPSF